MVIEKLQDHRLSTLIENMNWICWICLCIFYRPQRSCGKVMFLHLSVSHSVHRGRGCLPQCMLGYPPPLAGTPPGQVHPQANTPPRQVHPPGRYTPQASTPPGQVHPPWQVTPPGHVHPHGQAHSPGRYTPLTPPPPPTVTAADHTHPTGMLSCLFLFLVFLLSWTLLTSRVCFCDGKMDCPISHLINFHYVNWYHITFHRTEVLIELTCSWL